MVPRDGSKTVSFLAKCAQSREGGGSVTDSLFPLSKDVTPIESHFALSFVSRPFDLRRREISLAFLIPLPDWEDPCLTCFVPLGRRPAREWPCHSTPPTFFVPRPMPNDLSCARTLLGFR